MDKFLSCPEWGQTVFSFASSLFHVYFPFASLLGSIYCSQTLLIAFNCCIALLCRWEWLSVRAMAKDHCWRLASAQKERKPGLIAGADVGKSTPWQHEHTADLEAALNLSRLHMGKGENVQLSYNLLFKITWKALQFSFQ